MPYEALVHAHEDVDRVAAPHRQALVKRDHPVGLAKQLRPGTPRLVCVRCNRVLCLSCGGVVGPSLPPQKKGLHVWGGSVCTGRAAREWGKKSNATGVAKSMCRMRL